VQVSYGKLTVNDRKETVTDASPQRHDVTQ